MVYRIWYLQFKMQYLFSAVTMVMMGLLALVSFSSIIALIVNSRFQSRTARSISSLQVSERCNSTVSDVSHTSSVYESLGIGWSRDAAPRPYSLLSESSSTGGSIRSDIYQDHGALTSRKLPLPPLPVDDPRQQSSIDNSLKDPRSSTMPRPKRRRSMRKFSTSSHGGVHSEARCGGCLTTPFPVYSIPIDEDSFPTYDMLLNWYMHERKFGTALSNNRQNYEVNYTDAYMKPTDCPLHSFKTSRVQNRDMRRLQQKSCCVGSRHRGIYSESIDTNVHAREEVTNANTEHIYSDPLDAEHFEFDTLENNGKAEVVLADT